MPRYMKSMIRWLEAHAADGKLILTRQESMGLLSTEAGRDLALDLEDVLDLTAAEPTEAELAAALDDVD